MSRKIWTSWAVLAAAAGVALTGCGSSGTSDESVAEGTAATRTHSEDAAGGSDRSSAAPQGAGSAGRTDTDRSKGDQDQSVSSAKDRADVRIARTASLSMTVEDVDRAAARVRSAARSAGGYVSDEDSRTSEDTGRSWAEITLTVPVKQLDSTLTDLTEIGEVTRRETSAEDITTQYTDTSSRVKTTTKSVERLRDLIDSTDDLDQIVTLERELATREADLESWTAQQKALEHRSETAPVTVSLSTDGERTEQDEEGAPGFLAGLADGWEAFTSALAVGLTLLGAVTPFAVVAAILLAPLAVWRRRRRAAHPVPVAATGPTSDE